ncbi:glycosyltransferase family 2 protein [Pelagirhabdus alkalitolerans]|nr:glycosyltransferase family A protein [Pelagirhabdus alkalitolerans]
MINFLLKPIKETVSRLLTTEMKEKISGTLTEKQKKRIKQIFKPNPQFENLKNTLYQLNNLGFTEQGLIDLETYTSKTYSHKVRMVALWELATWYANQASAASAEKALFYLGHIEINNRDTVKKRRKSILQAECLSMIGKSSEAEKLLAQRLKFDQHYDLIYAKSNLKDSMDCKIEQLNQVYKMHKLQLIEPCESDVSTLYDRLHTKVTNPVYEPIRVSIIVPTFNASNYVETAIRSLFNQTWTNIEIIAVDDCSQDDTLAVLNKLKAEDERLIVLQTKKNGGAYIARNYALDVASGDAITINDADDWSHSEKIEKQVRNLFSDRRLVGNYSNQARLTNDLTFFRRGQQGQYVFKNMSSFMFKKDKVLKALGYWDSIRFGADGEFITRIKRVFGEKSIKVLNTPPLSFQRQTEASLTGNSAFGYPGFFMGVRKEYVEAHTYYHQQYSDNLYYKFPQTERPFPVPEPMWPRRENKGEDGFRQFDIVIASDFRLTDHFIREQLNDIRLYKERNLKVGIVQMNRYDIHAQKHINTLVREELDGDSTQMICFGEKVACDRLIIRDPATLDKQQLYIPDIEANNIKVIINHLPNESGQTSYGFDNAVENLDTYFSKQATWYPADQEIRNEILENDYKGINLINLADKNWIALRNE